MATGRPPIKLVKNEAWEVRTVPLGTQPGLAAAIEGVAVDARRLYLTYYLVTTNLFPSRGDCPVARIVVC